MNTLKAGFFRNELERTHILKDFFVLIILKCTKIRSYFILAP